MKKGRKGFGEELRIIERYSELSVLYFQRLDERLRSEDKNEQNFALQLLNGAFVKMIPQDVNQTSENHNFNQEVKASPKEVEAVKQALAQSLPKKRS